MGPQTPDWGAYNTPPPPKPPAVLNAAWDSTCDAFGMVSFFPIAISRLFF